jgi:NhaP-type Na+/H+ or K+/H+ antiporter
MFLELGGAVCFGMVIGFVTYRTLRRSHESVSLSNIATVIGAVGGAAVTALFQSSQMFGAYCIGLAAGFFLYLILAETVIDNSTWLGGRD